MTIRELLRKKLTQEELALVPSSFDIIGSKERAVAIIDIPKELEKKNNEIAKAIMKKHKNVKGVLKKASPIKGLHRVRDYELIAGNEKTEVVHSENSCRFLLDPQVVYFSPRESTERLRVSEQVRDGDIVMVFFAGVGPFPLVIERKANPSRIIAVEINPVAVEYLWKNVRLNKSQKIEVVLGDVTGNVGQYYGQCDRVLMPLPEKSVEYLQEAIKCLRTGGVCYFYCFSSEHDLDDKKDRMQSIARSMKRKIRFIGVQKVLPYGPRISKYRIDFELVR